MTALMASFGHIRDRLVMVKLLQTLLHDVAFLERVHLLDREQKYGARFIRIFERFKHRIMGRKSECVPMHRIDPLSSTPNEQVPGSSRLSALRRMAMNSKKIIFRRQPVSKRVVLRNARRPPPALSAETERTTNRTVDDGQVTFEHFTERSMEIVDCIVSGNMESLSRFVTRSPPKMQPKPQRDTVNVLEKRNNAVPPPPVFEPFRARGTESDSTSKSNLKSNLNAVLLPVPSPSSSSSSSSTVTVPSVRSGDGRPSERKKTSDSAVHLVPIESALSSSIGSAVDGDTARSAPDIVPSTDFEDDIPLNPYGATSTLDDAVHRDDGQPLQSQYRRARRFEDDGPADPYSNVRGQSGRNVHRRGYPPRRQSQGRGQGLNQDEDFSFDFQRISNGQRVRNSVSRDQPMRRGVGGGFGDHHYGRNGVDGQRHSPQFGYPPPSNQGDPASMEYDGRPPPPKKQKTNDDDKVVADDQLSDLLGFLCK